MHQAIVTKTVFITQIDVSNKQHLIYVIKLQDLEKKCLQK